MTVFGSNIVGRKTLSLLGVGTGAAVTIVASTPGAAKRIRILGGNVTTNSAAAVVTIADAAGSKLGDFLTLAPVLLPIADCGWYDTGVDQALQITVTAGTAYGGVLVYEVVT